MISYKHITKIIGVAMTVAVVFLLLADDFFAEGGRNIEPCQRDNGI